MSKENCDIINLGRWFLDLIYHIVGCDCKNPKT